MQDERLSEKRNRCCALLGSLILLDFILIGWYLKTPLSLHKLVPLSFRAEWSKVMSKGVPDAVPKVVFNDSGQPDSPYLQKECYRYDNLKAEFICNSPFLKFSQDLIFQCASSLWQKNRDPTVNDPWQRHAKAPAGLDDAALSESPEGGLLQRQHFFTKGGDDENTVKKRPAIHLMLVGDSHIRYIFEVLVKRIANPRVRYRIASFEEDEWHDPYAMIQLKKKTIHEAYHEIIHLDVPLRITYRWDAFLKDLPPLLDSWNSKSSPRPSYLLLGTTLHYMRATEDIYWASGPEKASKNFTKQLQILRPILDKFAAETPTVFKLQDHLQRHPKNTIPNQDNIDLYNDIAWKVLSGTRVKLWDSALPLADLYNEECRLRPKNNKNLGLWICNDRRHIGYIMIEQYLDMLLNVICNDSRS